jgi:hypothetical protein
VHNRRTSTGVILQVSDNGAFLKYPSYFVTFLVRIVQEKIEAFTPRTETQNIRQTQASCPFGGINELKQITDTNKTKTNSVASVRERTMPNELQPLVGEVIANLCG